MKSEWTDYRSTSARGRCSVIALGPYIAQVQRCMQTKGGLTTEGEWFFWIDCGNDSVQLLDGQWTNILQAESLEQAKAIAEAKLKEELPRLLASAIEFLKEEPCNSLS